MYFSIIKYFQIKLLFQNQSKTAMN